MLWLILIKLLSEKIKFNSSSDMEHPHVFSLNPFPCEKSTHQWERMGSFQEVVTGKTLFLIYFSIEPKLDVEFEIF